MIRSLGARTITTAYRGGCKLQWFGQRQGSFMCSESPLQLITQPQRCSYYFADTVRIYSSSSQRPPRGGGRLRSSIGMITAGGALLLGKGKYILGALKLTKVRSSC